MIKRNDLFYILKLNVSNIIENEYNINISFDNAKKQGLVVSIGDNQVFKFIRDIKYIDFSKQKSKVEELYKLRNIIKAQPKSYDNSQIIFNYQKQIDEILYLPDIISIHANTSKKQYKKVCKNKFIINGIIYKRLCAGAGQLRRNTALFVNEKYYNQLEEIMLCGLTKKRIGNINLAKFSAYYSLYSSSTNTITTPRVCVVKDYELLLKNQKVEWIYTKDNGERDIEPREININQNVFDGMGMVSIEMAEQWDKDLNIKHQGSAYIIRSAWIKGLCVKFDWKRFARDVAHQEYITDAWGHRKHIDNIDVILTTSQFKMWKKYENWEDYLNYHEKYGHIWGCSRVNKEKDNYLSPLNYQYIQSNSFTSKNIKKLADFSIDWVKKVSTGDRIFVLLYLLGCHENDKSIDEIERTTGISIAKALMYNKDILKDSYVRNRIYKSIEKKITQIKIGKLLIEGSYEFAIIDPYMLSEYIFGFENPQGLLKKGQLWQKRWVDKKTKEVAVMRSPLVSPHENQILEVYSDEICNNWFSTINSGIIINGLDTTLMRASDGDADGDLLLTTDAIELLDSIDRELLPITYDKSTVKEQSITYNNLVNMDTKSFNTKIGFITNLATSFICLRDQYDKNSDEYKELTKRINLLRFHQGSAIDAGKGNLYIPPSTHWSKKQKINYDSDSEEEKKKKYFINKLVGNKKSYFMGYIYPSLMKSYKQHKTTSKKICRASFNARLEDIFKKSNRTEEEKKFIRNYYKYLPVLTNKSIMNELCWYVEDADIDFKFFKDDKMFDYTLLLNDDYKININSNIYNKIDKILGKYHHIYEMNIHERKSMSEDDQYLYEFSEDDIKDEFSLLFKEIENDLFLICSNKYELCNYVVYITYNRFKNKSKAIMWNTCGEEIVDNLKRKNKKAYFPSETTKELGVEYLGKYYFLQEVDIIDNI